MPHAARRLVEIPKVGSVRAVVSGGAATSLSTRGEHVTLLAPGSACLVLVN